MRVRHTFGYYRVTNRCFLLQWSEKGRVCECVCETSGCPAKQWNRELQRPLLMSLLFVAPPPEQLGHRRLLPAFVLFGACGRRAERHRLRDHEQ